MKKLFIIGTILLIPFIMLSCTDDSKNIITSALEQGELALANTDYQKALNSFNLAIDKGDTTEKTKKITDIINLYLQSKSEFENGNIDEALDYINLIDKSYSEYSIKNDINQLKEKLTEKKINTNNKTKKADNSKINDDNYKSKLRNKREYYLKDLRYLEENTEEDFSNANTVTMLELLYKELNLWDKKLNEIYQYLKVNLPEEEFKKLKSKQIAWISYRDNKADSTLVTGGSVDDFNYVGTLIQVTKDRCYEFIDEYMK